MEQTREPTSLIAAELVKVDKYLGLTVSAIFHLVR